MYVRYRISAYQIYIDRHLNYRRRYMDAILPIRRKNTNQSINQSINKRYKLISVEYIPLQIIKDMNLNQPMQCSSFSSFQSQYISWI